MPSRRNRARSVYVEPLEPRHLLASGITASMNSAGLLKIVGTNDDDRIFIRQSNDRILVKGVSGSWATSKVSSIRVAVRGGDDYVSLDSLTNGGRQVLTESLNIYSGEGQERVRLANGRDAYFFGEGHRLTVTTRAVKLDGEVYDWSSSTPTPVGAGISASLNSKGLLKVYGTNGDDQILFRQIDGKISINGHDTSWAVSQVRSIRVELNAGDDYVSLDSLANGGNQALGESFNIYSGKGQELVQLADGREVEFDGPGHRLTVTSNGVRLDGVLLDWQDDPEPPPSDPDPIPPPPDPDPTPPPDPTLPPPDSSGKFIPTHSDPYIPDPGYGSTFHSVAGLGPIAWSDAEAWTAGRAPTADDRVVIAAGSELVIRDTEAIAYSITVQDGGRLRFDTTVNTKLRVVTLVVLGELEIGTVQSPVAAGVTATLEFRDVAIDPAKDPAAYGNGLIAVDAKIQIHGQQLSDTFVRLASEPRLGDTQIVLSEAVSGWRVGDRLVLPDSRDWAPESGQTYVPGWEEITIGAISADGRTITLSAPLGFDHPGARDGDGSLVFLPHVINLGRNVVIKSESAGGTRGHTMFTGATDLDIRYAAFIGLGRTTIDPLDSTTFDSQGNPTHIGTNQIARYPVHFHHMTLAPTFVGNSVFCPMPDIRFKWGITIHHTNNGYFAENVVYNWAGAGIAIEDGMETGNVLENNFVLRISGTGLREDRAPGSEGAGYWLHGSNNYVRDNVAANVTTFAYTLWGDKVEQVPILEFSGNEAYGVPNGLTIWELGALLGRTVYDIPQSVIQDMKLWHVSDDGLYGYGMNNVTFDGWTQIGDLARVQANPSANRMTGLHFGDYITRNVTIINANIQNLRTGIRAPYKAGDPLDLYGNAARAFVVKDSYLRNLKNIVTKTMFATSAALVPRLTTVDNVRFGSLLPGVRGEQYNIARIYGRAGSNPNFVLEDQLLVTSYNGVQGSDFRVYYLEQHPDYIVPATEQIGGNHTTGAPEAGLTNAEAWAQYGIAIAGGVADSFQIIDGVRGYIST